MSLIDFTTLLLADDQDFDYDSLLNAL